MTKSKTVAQMQKNSKMTENSGSGGSAKKVWDDHEITPLEYETLTDLLRSLQTMGNSPMAKSLL